MATDRFVSYAQNLEDVLLWRALHAAVDGTGFYVDVGASHPTNLSVTRAFYDRGWRGIDIEPLPDEATMLRGARPRDIVVQQAVGAAPGRMAFHVVRHKGQTGLSTLDGAAARAHARGGAEVEPIEVEVTTLAEIWRAHVAEPVHFLKIDAEGAEAAVLDGADFGGHRPWIVLLEAADPTPPAWEPGLLAQDYDPVWFDGLNRWYLAREHAALASHFRLPPNIFDAYVQYDFPLQDHLAVVETLVLARLERIEYLEAELARLRPAPPDVEPPAPEPAPEPHPEPAPEPPPPAEPPRPPSLLRRAALLAYRPFRPVLRPAAWRLRNFLVGDLTANMTDLRARHDLLVHTIRTLAERPPVVIPPPPPPDPALERTLERVLLTLAIADARDPSPPGLAPPPAERP